MRCRAAAPVPTHTQARFGSGIFSFASILFLLTLVGCGAVAYFRMAFLSSWPEEFHPAIPMVASIAMAFVAIYLSIAVHEVGHLLAAVALGWRVKAVAVGPLHWEHSFFPRWRWRSDDNVWGYVSSVPLRPPPWRAAQAVLSASGPLANIGAYVVATLIASSTAGVSRIFVDYLGLISLGLGLLNVLPARIGKVTTDGKDFIEAIFGRSEMAPVLELNRQAELGIPAREWPAETVAKVEAMAAKDDNGSLNWILFQRYWGCGDLPRARAAFEKVFRGVEGDRGAYNVPYAFMIAVLDRDGGRAMRLLDNVPPECRDTYGYWRATAAAAEARNDMHGLTTVLSEAQRIASASKMEFDSDDEALLLRWQALTQAEYSQ